VDGSLRKLNGSLQKYVTGISVRLLWETLDGNSDPEREMKHRSFFVVGLDTSAAFDTIIHETLVERLNVEFGISSVATLECEECQYADDTRVYSSMRACDSDAGLEMLAACTYAVSMLEQFSQSLPRSIRSVSTSTND